MKYRHVLAMLLGYGCDMALGDPRWLHHPVVFIGKEISALEKQIRKAFPKTPRGELSGGALEVLLVCSLGGGIPLAVLSFLYRHFPAAGFLLESFWSYQLLATRCLRDESMKVYDRLKNGTLQEAREAVSMIVGRDTAALSEEGVTKAAVETVAENASDGVIAPMFYQALGGVPLMFLYKAINTMDSMLGYKNDRYLYFGRAAARLDDAANFLPSRISAVLMILGSYICGLDGKNAARIYRRDRKKHASPNSGETESVMAGALGVQLGGDAYYFGKLVKKPALGDAARKVEIEDIPRANRLLYVTSALGLILFSLIRLFIDTHGEKNE